MAGLEHPKRFATLTLIVLVGLGLMVANLRRGRAGRRLIAVRTNERAAAAMGISVSGAKTYAFVLAGMIAAAGGVLFAFFLPTPDFTNFVGLSSISVTETAVLGGVGHFGGPLIASGYQPNALPTQLFSFLGGNVATYLIIIAGALLLVFLPISRTVCRPRPSGRTPVVGRPTPPGADEVATDDRYIRPFDRTVGCPQEFAPRGRVRAIRRDAGLRSPVSGGGAGSGLRPDRSERGRKVHGHRRHHGIREDERGSVFLGDENISGWAPERRARAGLARSFQSLELFDDLSVEENVLAASDSRDRRAYLTDLFHPGVLRLVGLAGDAVSDFGLEGRLESQARHLSYAQRRLLAVARAVAGRVRPAARRASGRVGFR